MSFDKVSAVDKSHQGDVTCIIFNNGNLFSAGSDGKVKASLEFCGIFVFFFNYSVLVDLGLGFKLQKGTYHP